MVHNLVYNLCESLVENIGGVAGIGKKTPPTPITYLTQWKIVGNSEVHTLPYPDGVVLPNGYKRCEYIESDGTSYIELTYGFTVTDEIYIKCAMSQIVDWGGVIAPKTWDTEHNKRFLLGGAVLENSVRVFTSSFGVVGPANGVLTPQIVVDTNAHEWAYFNNTFTLDGNSSKTYSTFENVSTDELRLFYGYNIPRKYRIYDYRHKKANAEYHLIPCLDSNDTPCMYDVINNQAYYNSADSGSFTYKLYPQPTEIWSCGEYSAVDGKYHILVQPLGGSIADIALDEPLRKVNNVADSIEFVNGVATITRVLCCINMGDFNNFRKAQTTKTSSDGIYGIAAMPLSGGGYMSAKGVTSNAYVGNILMAMYPSVSRYATYSPSVTMGVSITSDKVICFYDDNYNQEDSFIEFQALMQELQPELIYELETPTTELVDAPQIEEAESYSMVISQGGKAVSWSSFETN